MRKIGISLLLLLLSIPVKADFNDGVAAYLMGNYEQAYSIMRPLAETANHPYAQYYLGMMYYQGQAVDQNYEEAGEWFRKAAEQGIPHAQYKLGNLYMKGLGVPRDYEYAYAWYRTGAEFKHKLSMTAVHKAREQLSNEELKEAEKLSAEFINKYGPKEKDLDKPKQVRNR
ncbi:MAG: tetratricopeptide repeat protein [Gammaproteobacteria bacterium]